MLRFPCVAFVWSMMNTLNSSWPKMVRKCMDPQRKLILISNWELLTKTVGQLLYETEQHVANGNGMYKFRFFFISTMYLITNTLQKEYFFVFWLCINSIHLNLIDTRLNWRNVFGGAFHSLLKIYCIKACSVYRCRVAE